jgi:DNA-binding MarR family transcriptional regulator
MTSRKNRSSSVEAASKAGTEPAPTEPSERLDASYLEGLIGYNARRAALTVIGVFLERMAPYGLRPVEFSTLSLIHHNPGVTARQLCQTLGLQPPNMVGTIAQFEKRGLLQRKPHPSDGRAQGLHLTAEGQALMQRAERTAAELEVEATQRLSAAERTRLMALLQKIYL